MPSFRYHQSPYAVIQERCKKCYGKLVLEEGGTERKDHRIDVVFFPLQGQRIGFLGVGMKIVHNESFWALYKGLGAVVSGIVPKMAIRFSSFELYKSYLADTDGVVSTKAVFLGKQDARMHFSMLFVYHHIRICLLIYIYIYIYSWATCWYYGSSVGGLSYGFD